ncbi:hypothetical protein ACRALDRAFT_2037940, partial [Sodiomyces alcalophilus JCM 7366]|uniref:uncharacterized protein n=1 Tax=Sodiomyces alcalophilus JCM 7366 TaxID=591952 RepID=UPI0039B471D2
MSRCVQDKLAREKPARILFQGVNTQRRNLRQGEENIRLRLLVVMIVLGLKDPNSSGTLTRRRGGEMEAENLSSNYP